MATTAGIACYEMLDDLEPLIEREGIVEVVGGGGPKTADADADVGEGDEEQPLVLRPSGTRHQVLDRKSLDQILRLEGGGAAGEDDDSLIAEPSQDTDMGDEDECNGDDGVEGGTPKWAANDRAGKRHRRSCVILDDSDDDADGGDGDAAADGDSDYDVEASASSESENVDDDDLSVEDLDEEEEEKEELGNECNRRRSRRRSRGAPSTVVARKPIAKCDAETIKFLERELVEARRRVRHGEEEAAMARSLMERALDRTSVARAQAEALEAQITKVQLGVGSTIGAGTIRYVRAPRIRKSIDGVVRTETDRRPNRDNLPGILGCAGASEAQVSDQVDIQALARRALPEERQAGTMPRAAAAEAPAGETVGGATAGAHAGAQAGGQGSSHLWSKAEEDALCRGVKRYGAGRWTAIKADAEFGVVLANRPSYSVRDKWRSKNFAKFREAVEREMTQDPPGGSVSKGTRVQVSHTLLPPHSLTPSLPPSLSLSLSLSIHASIHLHPSTGLTPVTPPSRTHTPRPLLPAPSSSPSPFFPQVKFNIGTYKGTVVESDPRRVFVRYEDGDEEWVSLTSPRLKIIHADGCSNPKHKAHKRKRNGEGKGKGEGKGEGKGKQPAMGKAVVCAALAWLRSIAMAPAEAAAMRGGGGHNLPTRGCYIPHTQLEASAAAAAPSCVGPAPGALEERG